MNVHFRTLTVVTVFGGLLLSQPECLAGEERGFYAGADVGGTTAESTSLKEFPDAPSGGNVEFNAGARLSLNGGYRFNNWFSLGAEMGYMFNTVKGADIALAQSPLLANVEFRMPNKSRFEPFIGGGPGFSLTVISLDDDGLNGGSDVDGSAGDTVFAWQAYGGVRYKINPTMSVGVVYKYFEADAANWDVGGTSQDIRFGRATVHTFSGSFQWNF